MTTIKESAQAYTPTQGFKNIAEIEKVHIDMDLKQDSFVNQDGKVVEYEYFMDGEQRVKLPVSVKEQLKQLISENPTMQYFKVNKTGEGMGTKYYVIPLPN